MNARERRAMDQTVLRIAQETLHLETLEERKMDRLDFKEQAVWGVKKALEDAYRAGLTAQVKARSKKIAAALLAALGDDDAEHLALAQEIVAQALTE
ncbi:MAG: hypothetical protein AMXMBFR7_49160 [Planctomycetota bacterium]